MAEQRGASDMDDIERRIRAAMLIAGVDSFRELAQRIDTRGLGETTLRRLDTSATRPQKRAVAEACGLPYEWFTVDFARLPELAGPPVTAEPAPAEELHALRQAVEQMRSELTALPALLERVQDLEQAVSRPSSGKRAPSRAAQGGPQR